ncbi:DUF4825 domain-containing protein [Jeotgalibacillus sp. HH7-29]|uniref:DUF4825 domain-containing protein n=1 Tax=Jeotgalibacillus haloalkalitolerans TaxID=3104292 RepID=A0ABU5KN88_9BACL|nr:DUF4825 domain-containing protein [Jeotgalibacillus sp. HH7-29]
MLFLSGCTANAEKADFDIFQYKDSYVGDNSAVVNSVIHLQGEAYFSGLELQTKDEPYGVTVKYDWEESALDAKETMIHNASYLFTLLQNVSWISFEFEMPNGVDGYQVTRESLEEVYGVDLLDIDDEDELKELIGELLEDEKKVNDLLD